MAIIALVISLHCDFNIDMMGQAINTPQRRSRTCSVKESAWFQRSAPRPWHIGLYNQPLSNEGFHCSIPLVDMSVAGEVPEFPKPSPHINYTCQSPKFSQIRSDGMLIVDCDHKDGAMVLMGGVPQKCKMKNVKWMGIPKEDLKELKFPLCANPTNDTPYFKYTGPFSVDDDYDVVSVQCGEYYNYLTNPRRSMDEKIRLSQKVEQLYISRPPSISIIVLDTTSANSFFRGAPNTTSVLECLGERVVKQTTERPAQSASDVEVFFFPRTSTVGVSTFANVPQLCGGCRPNPGSLGKDDNTYCANATWNQDFFEGRGYATMIASDLNYCHSSSSRNKDALSTIDVSGSMINWGWANQHGLPNGELNEKNEFFVAWKPSSDDLRSHCLGGEYSHEKLFQAARKFREFYEPHVPTYVWSHLAGNHVSHQSGITGSIDNGLAEHITSSFGQTGVTLLIADHGLGYGKYYDTSFGAAEHQMPFAALVVPKKYLTDKMTRTMQQNENKLVTVYDFLVTLRSMPARSTQGVAESEMKPTRGWAAEDELPPLGVDLFAESVSKDRTCIEAGVSSPQFCSCTRWESVPPYKGALKQRLITMAVDEAQRLQGTSETAGRLCHRWEARFFELSDEFLASHLGDAMPWVKMSIRPRHLELIHVRIVAKVNPSSVVEARLSLDVTLEAAFRSDVSFKDRDGDDVTLKLLSVKRNSPYDHEVCKTPLIPRANMEYCVCRDGNTFKDSG